MKTDTAKMDAVFGDVVSDIDKVSKWREPRTPPAEAKRWDRNPVIMKRKGVLSEFFTIGALGEALSRKTVTIRSWEAKKIIPRAPYREEAPLLKDPNKVPLPGKALVGRRLYFRSHIEAAVAAAKASGVYDPSNAPNANWAEFTRLVRLAWASL